MFVWCECCVLSCRGLCDGLITGPEKSYRLWRVVVCYLETSKMRRLKPATGLWKIQPKGCNAKKTNKNMSVIDGQIRRNDAVIMTGKMKNSDKYELQFHFVHHKFR